MKVVSIFARHLTPWKQAHYEAGEVVVVECCAAIEATNTTLDATVSLTITNF